MGEFRPRLATPSTILREPMGIVLVNAAVSLDGFIADPNHEMDWIFDHQFLPDEPIDDVIRTTGAILTGRGSYEVGRRSERSETSSAFGGRWSGPEFVLTHRPPADDETREVSFLSGSIAQAVSTSPAAAQGKNLLVLAPTSCGNVSTRIRSTRFSSCSCRSCSAMGLACSVRLVAGRSSSRLSAWRRRVRWLSCGFVGGGKRGGVGTPLCSRRCAHHDGTHMGVCDQSDLRSVCVGGGSH